MIARTALAVLLACAALNARVTRIVIEQRESPAYKGQEFGKAGKYETLSGHFYGELDPKDPHNAIITDIQFAPRNSRGMVEYSASFALSKPIDMAHSSGVLFYSVPNRGNGAPNASAEGHVSIVSGWQGDLIARPGLPDHYPARGEEPQRIAAHRTRLRALRQHAAGHHHTRHRHRTLHRAHLSAPPHARYVEGFPHQTPIAHRAGRSHPRQRLGLRRLHKVRLPGTPDSSKICLKSGFDPAFQYELVFTAKDPLVLGIGFAATRDLNSFLRYADKDDTGNANPVAGKIKWGFSRGSSQSGNFIRTFINLGFNQDEAASCGTAPIRTSLRASSP